MATVKIEFPEFHTCWEGCARAKLFDQGTKTLYSPKLVDGRCPRYGKIEAWAVNILDYNESIWHDQGYIKGDEVVIPDPQIRLRIWDPLHGMDVEMDLESVSDTGFTRRQLVAVIAEHVNTYFEAHVDSPQGTWGRLMRDITYDPSTRLAEVMIEN